MKKLILLSAIIFGTLCVSAQKKWNYPATPAKPVYDTIWGKIIKDDYRWMENTEDPKFTQWLKDQNQFTLDVMNTIPNQDKIYQSWMDIMEGLGVFYAEINGNGHASIYKRATAEENVSKLYYRNKSNNKEEMLFDPETYIEGKMHSITGLRMSDDGKYALFNVSEAGKENGKIRIMDLSAKKLLPEELPGMYASFVTIGGKHHIAYLALNNEDVHKNSYKGGELKLHVPGTKISEDKTIITSASNPEINYDDQFNFLAPVTYNHPEYLIVEIFDASAFTRLYYIRKSEIFGKKPFWKPLVTKDDQQLPMSQFLTGNSLYFITSKNSPFYEFRKSELNDLQTGKSELLYAPPKDWKIASLGKSKDYFIIQITKNDLESKNFVYDIKTKKIEELIIPLTGIISVTPLGPNTNETTVRALSWKTFSSNYTYDLTERKLQKGWFYSEGKIPENPYLTVEEIEIPSHDGVLVPLSIVYDKRYLKKDGSNICLMYGYGAFGISTRPSPTVPSYFYEQGLIYAVPHVRGGGEKGLDWYMGGKKETKSNSWKDWVAAAEWLIKNKYTSPEKLGIEGGSAGGQLVGRLAVYRPDLFRVAIVKVGVLNTMRGEFTPNPTPLIGDYGTIKDEKEAAYLYDSDAYLNVKPGTRYPAQYITAGYNDPRVIVWQPAKYAAAVQNAGANFHPHFLYTEFEGGHGGGLNFSERMKAFAREGAFLLWQTGHPDFQPK